MNQTSFRPEVPSGAEVPIIYLIRFKDAVECVALEIDSGYVFNLCQSWRLVPTELVNQLLDETNDIILSDLKNQFSSSNDKAIELLIIGYNLFGTAPVLFKSFFEKMKQSMVSKKIQNVLVSFIPLSSYDVRSRFIFDHTLWKNIYVTKILKAHGVVPYISNWEIMVVPHWVINPTTNLEKSFKLLQLRRAIKLLNNDPNWESDGNQEVIALTSKLDEAIKRINITLPDICLYLEYAPSTPCSDNFETLLDKGIEMLIGLHDLGIVVGDSNLKNILINTQGDIIVKSFEHIAYGPQHELTDCTDRANALWKDIYPKKTGFIKSPEYALSFLATYDILVFTMNIAHVDPNNRKVNRIIEVLKEALVNWNGNSQLDLREIMDKKELQRLDKVWNINCTNNRDASKYAYMRAYMMNIDIET